MVAWSDGQRAHLGSTQLYELKKDYFRKRGIYHWRVEQGYEWEIDECAVMRGDSLLAEEYSDQLWQLDQHVKSFEMLMGATEELIDWDHVDIGPETNYHHRNLTRYRYLIGRCLERVREDNRLSTLFYSSSVYKVYLEMESRYEGFKELGWLP